MSEWSRHYAVLQRLRMTGTLSASACGPALRSALAPLINGGVLAWEKSGGGRRLMVRQPGGLAEFLAARFPQAAANGSSRAQGVARFRDTKALPNDVPELLAVRAWQDGGLLVNGTPAEAAAATRRHGVFAFLLQTPSAYSLRGPVAMVENPAVFTAFEQLGLDRSLTIYGHGRASARLLDWLATSASDDFHLLHLADYDPVGLSEFLRLRARLGQRVSYYVPATLPELFRRFSQPALLRKPHSQALLRQLRQSQDPVVRQVVALMEEHHAGLEQEALLIGTEGVIRNL